MSDDCKCFGDESLPLLSTKDAAKCLGVDTKKIRRWIGTGELAAMDESEGETRPRWRIRPFDLESLRLKRLNRPAAPRRRRVRRAKASNGVTEWI